MEDLLSRIERHEGFIAQPKIDVAPNYCIGYGHDITPAEVDYYSAGITRQEALVLLENDVQNCKELGAKWFPWLLGLDEVRYSVIIEMIFQLGIAGVNGFPKMIAAIRDKDYTTASKEMLNSQWHRETPSRCEELSNLMLHGEN